MATKSKKRPATRAKARAKPKAKPRAKARASKPARAKAVRAAPKQAAAPHVAVPAAVEVHERGGPPPPPGKPGALARLKSGVGSLFARVTGRGNRPDVIEPERTIEIKTEDIILSEDRASARASED